MRVMAMVLLAMTITFLSSGCVSQPTLQNVSDSVCIKGTCFTVEVADTPDERATGLMHREHLDEGAGMLFVFDAEVEQSFWMKNTLIPLDMIWISEDGTVVFIKENALPCESDPCPVISPGKEAKYVLEINSGASSRAGMAVGDIAEIRISEA